MNPARVLVSDISLAQCEPCGDRPVAGAVQQVVAGANDDRSPGRCSGIVFRAFLHADVVLDAVTETRVALGIRAFLVGSVQGGGVDDEPVSDVGG
ncbi:hypothetical protein, partial [Rhodococcus sp. LB1]|uniref:hypothetical protein n=1 Tax=Rhodococcus sp. LB1 TaxID=1807499 RepID=UPI000A570D21